MVLAMLLLPETARIRSSRFDWAGALLLGLGITSVLLATNRGSAWGWTSPGVVSLYLIGVASVPAFVWAERRAPEPLLPLRWLRIRNVTAPVANQLFANFAYMGGFILTPVLLEEGLGYTAAAAGLLIIARPLTFSVAAPIAGRFTLRVGERAAGVSGALIVTLSMVMLAALRVNSSVIIILVALALSGMGLGVSAPAMTAAVANAVEDADLGVAGAIQQLAVQVGSVIGIQVMQTVQQATATSDGDIASFSIAYLVGAAVCLLAVASAWFVRSTPIVTDVPASPLNEVSASGAVAS
jgi:MFS family permease